MRKLRLWLLCLPKIFVKFLNMYSLNIKKAATKATFLNYYIEKYYPTNLFLTKYSAI